jgi:predicted PurR-regulated permease PerM
MLTAFLLVVPPMLSELGDLLKTFAPTLQSWSGGSIDLANVWNGTFTNSLNQFLDTIRASGITDAISRIFAVGSSAFNVLVGVVIVLILVFYLVVEKTSIAKSVSTFSPAMYQPFVKQLAGKMRDKMGAWLRGQLALMLSIFVLTYIALLLLKIPYALVLAFLAGLLEIIPFAGPLLSSIPAVILAFALSPLHAALTAGAYIVVQQVEGNILVPKIMQKVTGLNPIISLLAILIGWRVGGIVGGQVGGVLGAMLSIPLAMAISVFLGEVFKTSPDEPYAIES